MKRVILKGLIIVLSVFLTGCSNSEEKLIKQGEELAVKIEK